MRVEYWVFKKMVKQMGEFWDGPFTSKVRAVKAFKTTYMNHPPRSQDFRLVKITYEDVKIP